MHCTHAGGGGRAGGYFLYPAACNSPRHDQPTPPQAKARAALHEQGLEDAQGKMQALLNQAMQMRKANDDRVESVIKELNQTHRKHDSLRLKHAELLRAIGTFDPAMHPVAIPTGDARGSTTPPDPNGKPDKSKGKTKTKTKRGKRGGGEFEIGDRVQCRHEGGERFYPGVVKRARKDGTFDIDYLDGDKEKR